MSDVPLPFPVRHISTPIARPVAEVYSYTRDPANLPQWAAGIGASITKVNGAWIVPSPTGDVRVQFAAENEFGVLDHTVTLSTGVTFYNPMRAIPNGSGSEVVFTLFRLPGVTEASFEADAAAVATDLATLKALLER